MVRVLEHFFHSGEVSPRLHFSHQSPALRGVSEIEHVALVTLVSNATSATSVCLKGH